jgi:hypothetical protein
MFLKNGSQFCQEDLSNVHVKKDGIMKKIILVFLLLLIIPTLAIAAFDIQGFYNKYKDYYGDIPLEDVAQDVYERFFYKDYPDYNIWKKAVGIESVIQEDTKRRTPPPPPPPSFLDKVKGALPFRYTEEFIQGRLFRYDRLTKTVELRRSEGWVPIPQFKNLQHVRDVLTKRAIEDQSEELKKVTRSIEDLKYKVDAVKREQENRTILERR